MKHAGEPDELEILTDFLYIVPVGLIRFRLDGSIDLANPKVVQLLLPILATSDLTNAYAALGPIAPNLAERLAGSDVASGIVVDHERYTAVAGKHRVVLSLTVHRIDGESFMAVLEDMTLQAERERELIETKTDLASRRRHDPLTGLANRGLLETQLAELGKVDGANLTLLFVDIVGARAVNESLGFSAGDALLVDVARRLVVAAGSDDLVARLGGDHFVVLCRGLSQGAVNALCERVHAALAEPIDVEGGSFRVSASVAVAAVGGAPPSGRVCPVLTGGACSG